jgi:site-specific DNA recombinase
MIEGDYTPSTCANLFSKQAMFGLYAWIYESESQRISDRIKSVYHIKYKSGQL